MFAAHHCPRAPCSPVAGTIANDNACAPLRRDGVHWPSSRCGFVVTIQSGGGVRPSLCHHHTSAPRTPLKMMQHYNHTWMTIGLPYTRRVRACATLHAQRSPVCTRLFEPRPMYTMRCHHGKNRLTQRHLTTQSQALVRPCPMGATARCGRRVFASRAALVSPQVNLDDLSNSTGTANTVSAIDPLAAVVGTVRFSS